LSESELFMDKIVVIGHSYHEKTKSNASILELLQSKYEVELIYDDSWQTGLEPDVSHINETYRAVVFWQNISPQMLTNITCSNVIYFPMYDAVWDQGEDFWYPLRNIKIVCFSSTLHKKLMALNFNVFYIQHFPEPDIFEEVDHISVFFWQRRNEITWHTVTKLIKIVEVESIHIHKAVDPYQQFVSPTENEVAEYKITFSDWFESKDDYRNTMKSKSIYIAPRLREGIGFSFLEAMAMGKVVIAADNPTMNEYIVHGINGFLFDVNNPQPIEMNNLKAVQRNAHETVVAGRHKWNLNKNQIIDFIEAPSRAFRRSKKLVLKAALRRAVTIVKKSIKQVTPYGFIWCYRRFIKGLNEPF
jgi:glycosyltransferase involved in cell wall biosynthesis